jgi:hypothetical protein
VALPLSAAFAVGEPAALQLGLALFAPMLGRQAAETTTKVSSPCVQAAVPAPGETH